MRLIDADKLQDDGVNYSYDKSENFGVISTEYRFVNRAQIDNAPTVMAIPIEWIKKKSLEFLMNRNFRWATDFQEVIDLWKVENNIPLFDDELKITWERENEID